MRSPDRSSGVRLVTDYGADQDGTFPARALLEQLVHRDPGDETDYVPPCAGPAAYERVMPLVLFRLDRLEEALLHPRVLVRPAAVGATYRGLTLEDIRAPDGYEFRATVVPSGRRA